MAALPVANGKRYIIKGRTEEMIRRQKLVDYSLTECTYCSRWGKNFSLSLRIVGKLLKSH